MSMLRNRSEVALLREHFTLILVALLAAASLGLGLLSPRANGEVQIDSQRDVNELVCIPWLSKTFPVTRGTWVGLSKVPAGKDLALVRYGESEREIAAGEVFSASSGRDDFSVVVEGPAARHLSTSLWAVTDQGSAKGAASDECRAPNQSWWFSGIDTTAGSSATLVLANPDNEDVVATLNGFTSQGAVQSGSDRRVLVKAQSRAIVDLNLAFPAEPALSVHVKLSEGRLAASVQAWSVSASTSLGRTFVTPLSQPQLSGAIVGIRSGADRAELHLLAPEEDATVTVSISTADGTSALAQVDRLVLTAGKVRVVPVAALLSEQASSLVIESSHPVVAAVRTFAKRGSMQDLEVQTLQPNLGERASVIVNNAKASQQVFAYSKAGAVISYEVLRGGRRVLGGSIEVRPTTSMQIDFPSDIPRGAIIVLESQGEAAVTLWTLRSDGNSSAVPVRGESAAVVAGTSLILTTS